MIGSRLQATGGERQAGAGLQEDTGSHSKATDFHIRRGTNVSHWLSQSILQGNDRVNYFTEKDVIYLANHGFDHIRLPIDEEELWNMQQEKVRSSFQLLHQAMQWCYLHHLKVVIDLHTLRSRHYHTKEKPLWNDPEARERFLQCWRELSGELKRYPVSMLAYELLNEPLADSAEQWNELLAEGIAVIREREPRRVIVISNNGKHDLGSFDGLRVPAGDPNILLSFHYYNPLILTFHLARGFRFDDYNGPVHYPGPTVTQKEMDAEPATIRNLITGSTKPYNREVIQSQLQPALQAAKRLQLPLYCGEWGCLNTVPKRDRLRWYKDVRRVLEDNNIAWSNWDYKSKGFGFMGEDGEVDKSLLRALVK
ncbi:glycoside hydrolase family 5 protein [Chitinophaga japonensis]